MQMEPRTARALEATRTAVGSRFGKFGPEEEKASRKTDVKGYKGLEQIREIWRQFEFVTELVPQEFGSAEIIDYGESDDLVLDLLKDFRCSAQEVAAFAVGLAEFQDEANFSEKAGLFLSILIINGKDDDFTIPTKHLHNPITFLGRGNNGKNITVEGDVGSYLGNGMTAGIILVNGDAGFGPGTGLRGGKIIVKGNASHVGREMKGGEIHIEGEEMDVGWKPKGGKIFHKGKQVFGK
jgi:hypothetical protein